MATPAVSTRRGNANEKIQTNTKWDSDKYKLKLDSDSNTCCVNSAISLVATREIEMRKYD